MAGLGRTAVFGSPSLRVLLHIEDASVKFVDILECGSFSLVSWVFLLGEKYATQLYLDLELGVSKVPP